MPCWLCCSSSFPQTTAAPPGGACGFEARDWALAASLPGARCSRSFRPTPRGPPAPPCAGDIARELGKWDDIEECYSRAAEYYCSEGRQTAAADALAKGARALEERRPDVSAAL